MTYGIIYHWHCIKTNMGYVGQTTNTLIGRWKGHCYSAFRSNTQSGQWEFPKAIRENGVDSFVGRIICECETPEELDVAEQRYVAELNTLMPNGYNMLPGGSGKDAQTRQLISRRTREAMSSMLDTSWKSRQRDAMKNPDLKRSISHRTCVAMQRPEIVAKINASHTPEWKAKISDSLQGHVISLETREKIRKTLQSRPRKEKLTRSCLTCQSAFIPCKKTSKFCSKECYWGQS